MGEIYLDDRKEELLEKSYHFFLNKSTLFYSTLLNLCSYVYKKGSILNVGVC